MSKCVLIIILLYMDNRMDTNVHHGKYTYSTINGDNFHAFRYFILEPL